MADLQVKDAGASTVYVAATGAGSDPDPFILIKEVIQDTHDDLNLNANLQVGDADVSLTNPVPVEGADAENAAASDNPLLVGGRYDATPRTLGDGDAGAIALDADGAVHISDGGNSITVDGTVSVSGTVTVDNAGTFAVQVDGDALTALQLIDNIVQTEDAVHGTGDAGVMALAVRNDVLAALAGTDGDYAPLQVNASGALFIQEGAPLDVSAATVTITGTVTANLGATDNAVLDAIQAAVEIMDDWDETNRAAVNLISGQAAITGGAGAVAANTPRVTLASDDPAVVALQIIDDWDETNRAAVNIISGQAGVAAGAGAVGATVQRVTLASNDPAVTALQIIDDWDNAASDGASVSGDVAHDGADAGEPVKIGGRAQEPTAAPDEVANDDRVDRLHDRVGRAAIYQGYPRIYADINDAGSGDNTLIAAQGAGKKILVTSVLIISDGTVDVRFESGASGTALTGQMPLQAREGFFAHDPWGLFETAANALLNLELSAAVNVHGFVAGHVIDD